MGAACRVAIAAAVLSFACPLRADEPSARRIDVAVVPAGGYSSDKGLAVGLAAGLYVRRSGWEPYEYGLTLTLSGTTRGIRDYALKLDAPRFLGTRLRPMLTLGYLADPFRPFFGIGNEANPVLPVGLTGERFLTYGLTSWYALAGVEDDLGGPWRLRFGYGLRTLGMKVTPKSLMSIERPIGVSGGRSARLEVELVYDTRSEEASPVSGQYAAISLHGEAPILGSEFTNGGVAGELHDYFSPGGLGPRLVLAGRLLGDVTWGDVPVAMLPLFGGRFGIEGVGGSTSVRGLPRLRYVGQAKALANLELRSRVLRRQLFHRPIDLWVVAFADAGRVFATVAPDGDFWRFHFGRGLGVRLAYVEDFVVRLDVGFAEGSTSFYATVGQTF